MRLPRYARNDVSKRLPRYARNDGFGDTRRQKISIYPLSWSNCQGHICHGHSSIIAYFFFFRNKMNELFRFFFVFSRKATQNNKSVEYYVIERKKPQVFIRFKEVEFTYPLRRNTGGFL